MTHKTKRRIMSAFITACLIMGITACADKGGTAGESSGTDTGATTDKLKEIDVVLDWYPNAVHAFIYDAIEKGYYEEEGLKVNVQFPSNTNDAMSLTAAGKAAVGIYYQQDVILARANQDVPVKCIGTVTQSALNIILSLKDKNITSARDLEGKTVGYGTELSEAVVRSMMDNAGVDSSKVTLVDVGFDLLSSMTTGRVDATIGCMVNHEVPQLESEGFEVNYFYPSEYGIPDNYELIFISGDKTIENDKETLTAFMRASRKGFEDMKENPDAALSILLANQNEENFPLDKNVEMSSMEILIPVMFPENSSFGFQSEKVWQDNIDWMKAQGLIKGDITPADLMADVEK